MSVTSRAALTPESDSALADDGVPECPVAASEALYAKSADAFRTIGEAATELGLKTHVLRFWETKFDNLRPLKRTDGRRYYRPEDMELLRRLQNLLHVQGLTIRGAVKALEGEPGAASVSDSSTSVKLEGEERADDMIDPVKAGVSVHDLQVAVRVAAERGEFTASGAPSATRSRLETLLTDLTNLKLRLDTVRAA